MQRVMLQKISMQLTEVYVDQLFVTVKLIGVSFMVDLFGLQSIVIQSNAIQCSQEPFSLFLCSQLKSTQTTCKLIECSEGKYAVVNPISHNSATYTAGSCTLVMQTAILFNRGKWNDVQIRFAIA